jgi:PAS domain-containing protein
MENVQDIFVEISVNPIKVKDTTSYYLIIRDITERKLLERETLKNKLRYEALVNAIPDLIFVMDKNGYYVDYTADESSPLYVDPGMIIGKHLTDFFKDKEKVEEILEKIRDTIKTGKINKVKYSLDSPVGIRHFEARISKMDDEKILSIVRDITDWK